MVIQSLHIDSNDLLKFSVSSLIERCSQLREATTFFINQPPKVIGKDHPCLVIIESECVVARKKHLGPNSPKMLGSDWATTCVIVLFESSDFVACAHVVDPRTVFDILTTALNKMKDLSPMRNLGSVNVYLVGGFTDGQCSSEVSSMSCHICSDILIFLSKSEETTFHLKLLACYDVNSGPDHRPIHTGVAFCMDSCQVMPSNLENCFGPDIHLRRARLSVPFDSDLLFEPTEEKLRIAPFETSASEWELRQCMKLPDEVILGHFSTSPKAEPQGFAEAFRAKCAFLIENQPLRKSVFAGNKPRVHQLDAETGVWTLL